MSTNTFSIGDKVEWTSSSNARKTTKTGEIVAVVAPGPRFTVSFQKIAEQHNAVSMYGGGMPRDYESYLVLVPPATPRSKGKLYWPLVSKLRKI